MIFGFSTIFICLIFSLLLSLIIYITLFILSEKKTDKEKITSYECGFNHINVPGEPFSIRFFLTAILFLVFDL